MRYVASSQAPPVIESLACGQTCSPQNKWTGMVTLEASPTTLTLIMVPGPIKGNDTLQQLGGVCVEVAYRRTSAI